MLDERTRLVLENLQAVRADVAALRDEVRDVMARQDETHPAVLLVRSDRAADAAIVGHLQAQFDRLRGRVGRIERRLDLAEQGG
jgi:hypothetical protein